MSRLILISAFASLSVLFGQSVSFAQAGRDEKPAAAQAAKLTKSGYDKVKGGMTLAEVMALLGPRAQINPDPAPFGYGAPEVLVLWKEAKDRWAGVVFVPDKHRVLRVLDTEKTSGTYKGAEGLKD
jgi:hypothetical protein